MKPAPAVLVSLCTALFAGWLLGLSPTASLFTGLASIAAAALLRRTHREAERRFRRRS